MVATVLVSGNTDRDCLDQKDPRSFLQTNTSPKFSVRGFVLGKRVSTVFYLVFYLLSKVALGLEAPSGYYLVSKLQVNRIATKSDIFFSHGLRSTLARILDDIIVHIHVVLIVGKLSSAHQQS